MSLNLVNGVHSISQHLREEVYNLTSLANAFYETGNTHVADKLSRTAGRIALDIDALNVLLSDKITDDTRAAQESTSNMLAACLAGTVAAKPDPA